MKVIVGVLYSSVFAKATRVSNLWRVAFCVLLAAASAGLSGFNPNRSESGLAPAMHSDSAVRQLKAEGSFDSLMAAVTAARYQITRLPSESPRAGASYYANNPGQRLRVAFAAEEVRVDAVSERKDVNAVGQELHLRLAGYGYGARPHQLSAGVLRARGDRIEISRKVMGNPQSAIEEWYMNKPEGLEHGFTFTASPASPHNGEWLRVALTVGEGWRTILRDDQQGVLFERQSDGLRLSYDHLLAYDARGRSLPARMSLEEVPDGSTLALLVDDAQAVYPLTIDPILTQQQKLTAPDAAAGDQFGAAIALSGNTAIIGAPFDDVLGVDQGSAYVFVRTASSWSLQQQLTTPDGADGDRFGTAVAISGDSVIVGAPNHSSGVDVARGRAYVFVRTGSAWTEQSALSAFDGVAGDFFGFSVALSGDTAVVGAPSDDNGANPDQGSAYVFTRRDGTWSEQQKLITNDGAASDRFGSVVALSGDTVLASAPFDDINTSVDQGSVYAFTRMGTVWTQQQRLTANDGASNDFFGTALALSGETAVVGVSNDTVGTNSTQGSAYVFTRSGSVWAQQQKLTASDGASGDSFGTTVALSGDVIVAGAPFDDFGNSVNQGSAYVFSRNGTVWTQQQRISANDGAGSDFFGISAALSGDTVVIGAVGDDIGANANQGSAHVFVICTNNLARQQQLTASDGSGGDTFGFSVALSGDTVVVGAFFDDIGPKVDQGSAYVFTRSGTTWTQQQRLTADDGAAGSFFGFSVAINGDTVVVGAEAASAVQGAAYVFTRSGTVWTQQQKLVANDGAPADDFGRAVSLSADILVVGAFADDIGGNQNQGSAYVFSRSGALWTQQQKLTAIDGAANDFFGISVALSGDTVLVGSFFDDIGANVNQGSAYVFTRSGTLWTLQQKLVANDGAPNDNFGTAVALSGDTALVGSFLDDVGANADQGSAYVFTRSGAEWAQQQKLTPSDGLANDRFGGSVALNGDTLVVGAHALRGSAYVFTHGATLWTVQQKLGANEGVVFNDFGSSVALSGDTVVVGADTESIGSKRDQGAAYVFVCPACPTIALSPADLPGALIGVSYNQTVTAGGGEGPYQFSVSEGALPPGLKLAQNGQLSGVPTTLGTYGFTITATILSSLCPGSRSYSMTVSSPCPAITISPALLPAGVEGQEYRQILTATGGVVPVNFAVGEGKLPNGVSLSAAGLLSGPPTESGTFNFTVRVTDINGCRGTQAYSLTIGSPACQFSVAPINHAFSSEGGNGVVSVNAATGCAWTAVSDNPMITITSSTGGIGNGTLAFTVADNSNAGPRLGTLTIADTKVTVVQAPPITCVSAASFTGNSLATESIVAAFGSGMAQSTEVASTKPLTETLARTRVSVVDSLGTARFAPLFFVSPTQINFQIPPGTARGQALVMIVHDDQTVAADTVQIETISPGLFSANANGQGPTIGIALRVSADDSQRFEPIVHFDEEKKEFVAEPIDLGAATDRVFLVLFGTGLRFRTSLGHVSAEIGGVNADVFFAGPQGEFVGLDQLNVLLPRSLAGHGEVELSVLVEGRETNKLKVSIK